MDACKKKKMCSFAKSDDSLKDIYSIYIIKINKMYYVITIV